MKIWKRAYNVAFEEQGEEESFYKEQADHQHSWMNSTYVPQNRRGSVLEQTCAKRQEVFSALEFTLVVLSVSETASHLSYQHDTVQAYASALPRALEAWRPAYHWPTNSVWRSFFIGLI